MSEESFMSLISSRNSIGPNILPCGTPHFKNVSSERMLPIFTTCLQFGKSNSKQSLAISLIHVPQFWSFDSNILGSTVSNAFAKSKNTLQLQFALSSASAILVYKSNTGQVVALFFWKPNWCLQIKLFLSRKSKVKSQLA